ncbi:hypothetical protein HUU62_15375 [Rhodoferax sp. 4810]|nr:hypothetical protein [Rhodoferax jenense]
MQQIVRVLNSENINAITTDFHASLASIGESIQGKTGVSLFTALKREKLIGGPYPGVSLFEAANRIMSDLVILGGVSGLLEGGLFPFTSYTVEFGNENKNGFDIRAASGKETLVGEAFNVAQSFFQIKKGSALKKLRRDGSDATYRILMFNDDAASPKYSPKPEAGFYHVFVGVESGKCQVRPDPSYVGHAVSARN